jgi:hypothetical protein
LVEIRYMIVKRIVLMAAICLLSAGNVSAQDPGIQDSIIVENIMIEYAVDSIYVKVYVVTDDSVAFYNLPLEFTSTGYGINYADIRYIASGYDWDENFDDFVDEDDFLRMIGFYDLGGDDNTPLHTNSNRVHYLSIVFDIEPGAPSQVIFIDPTYDDVNGPVLFGLTDGITGFTPAFVSGVITYISSEDVPALSEWGMIILGLLLLAAGTVAIIRGRKEALINED